MQRDLVQANLIFHNHIYNKNVTKFITEQNDIFLLYLCFDDNLKRGIEFMEKKRVWWKILLKSVLWIVGIWAVVLVLLQATLSEKVLTKIVNKYSAEYIEGEVSFGSASVSVFKHFPRIFLTLEDFHITYPSERFDVADTLASFKRFSASLDIAALMNGTLRIPHLRLVQPRIFAHQYADGTANWDIIKVSTSEETEDTTSLVLPKISLGRISLSRHPHIVYTNSKDTVFAMIDVARIGFVGQINTNQPPRRKTERRFTPRNNTKGLTVDSLKVAGRYKKDTIALSVKNFYVHDKDGTLEIDGNAKALLATDFAGRVRLPIEISGKVDFPKDSVTAVSLKDFKAKVGDFPIVADADVRLHKDKAAIKARAGIRDCRLNDVFHGFAKNIIPELDKVETDARLTVIAECNGDYIFETGKLPKFTMTASLPESIIRYSELSDLDMRLEIAASGNSDNQGRIHARMDKVLFNTKGLDIDLKGNAKDLMGADPAISIDGNMHASLDSLITILPDTLGIAASGEIAGSIKGNALLSQLSIYNFSHADIVGNLSSDQIIVQMPSDTIDVNIKGLDVTVGPEERVSRRDSTKSFRLASVTAKIKHGKVVMGDALFAQTRNLLISAKNSENLALSGRLNAQILNVRDGAGTAIAFSETNNSFILRPKKDQPKVPVMSLTSRNEKITLSSDRNRAILGDATLKTRAEMNTVQREPRTRDTLMRRTASQRGTREVPEWMKEEDFRKQDIDLRLDETMAKYFREWNLNGEVSVGKGNVITPYFPNSNSLKGFGLSFTNDEVKIDSFKVKSGNSEIEARGRLSGLKRAMLGRSNRSVIKLDLDINSDKMNANELLAAYQKGLNYKPSSSTDKELSDAELMRMISASESLDTVDSTLSTLIVIPANLAADIRFNARNAIYADLIAEQISAELVMKERCLQITNTKAQTNMGEVSFDAFYSTKTKKDIKAGFDLNFKDITAEKAITLMPAIDTIMPLLKAFNGNLNCEIAATTDLDTTMNLVMPSINGVMRISGQNLSISENEVYRSLARKLLFKDKKEGHIEDMKLEAVIHDNTLEIFPFVVSVDRYSLAMSGIQSLDMSYKYHASVIKSPLPVKVGVDVYGEDFDNMKFKVGKAKYKSEDIPVFTAVIEETRINLLDAIQNIFEKGVDAAIREHGNQTAIREHKERIGYIRAVDMNVEELSEQEQKQVTEIENE